MAVKASVDSIDFQNITTRMHTLVNEDSGTQARAVEATPEMKWFKDAGEFTGDYTLQVGGQTVTAEMIARAEQRSKFPKSRV